MEEDDHPRRWRRHWRRDDRHHYVDHLIWRAQWGVKTVASLSPSLCSTLLCVRVHFCCFSCSCSCSSSSSLSLPWTIAQFWLIVMAVPLFFRFSTSTSSSSFSLVHSAEFLQICQLDAQVSRTLCFLFLSPTSCLLFCRAYNSSPRSASSLVSPNKFVCDFLLSVLSFCSSAYLMWDLFVYMYVCMYVCTLTSIWFLDCVQLGNNAPCDKIVFLVGLSVCLVGHLQCAVQAD